MDAASVVFEGERMSDKPLATWSEPGARTLSSLDL